MPTSVPFTSVPSSNPPAHFPGGDTACSEAPSVEGAGTNSLRCRDAQLFPRQGAEDRPSYRLASGASPADAGQAGFLSAVRRAGVLRLKPLTVARSAIEVPVPISLFEQLFLNFFQFITGCFFLAGFKGRNCLVQFLAFLHFVRCQSFVSSLVGRFHFFVTFAADRSHDVIDLVVEFVLPDFLAFHAFPRNFVHALCRRGVHSFCSFARFIAVGRFSVLLASVSCLRRGGTADQRGCGYRYQGFDGHVLSFEGGM